jgi:hypothetical protein
VIPASEIDKEAFMERAKQAYKNLGLEDALNQLIKEVKGE